MRAFNIIDARHRDLHHGVVVALRYEDGSRQAVQLRGGAAAAAVDAYHAGDPTALRAHVGAAPQEQFGPVKA